MTGLSPPLLRLGPLALRPGSRQDVLPAPSRWDPQGWRVCVANSHSLSRAHPLTLSHSYTLALSRVHALTFTRGARQTKRAVFAAHKRYVLGSFYPPGLGRPPAGIARRAGSGCLAAAAGSPRGPPSGAECARPGPSAPAPPRLLATDNVRDS
eukprot:1187050-Prorocentrum_minimum.AAC.2